ncbi:Uncharacterised protein [Bordetella pertussis]|nr:Uncharacterised protein [Bordetella pertussis]CFL87384.1 Uncharacterised protein [Bordetella pertussis]CFM17705.1 Uncharacterised protein [Bordetella pertussis]CFM35716.1 Uncharacterised protein [Bordetella pertussis]CFM63959.1 Uncharacterised protein [Bordetella pertussis]
MQGGADVGGAGVLQQLGDGADGRRPVQLHHQRLVARGVLEGLQRQLGVGVGAHLADHGEAALVDAALGAADIQQHAQAGFAQSALVDLRAQLGRARGHEVAVLGRNARMPARRPVLGAQAGPVLHQRRAIGGHEDPLAGRVAQVAPDVQARHDGVGRHLLQRPERVVRRGRLALFADLLGQLRDGRHPGVAVGNQLVGQAQRVHALHPLGRLRRDGGPHPRLHEAAVQAQIDVGNAGHRREALVVLLVALDDLAHVVQAAALERQHVVAVGQVGIGRVGRLVGDLGLVNAGRQHVDDVDVGGELLVLLARHRAGDEDAQVADALMHRVDDGLVVRHHFAVVLVQVGDPAQRLRRRRDVVALGAEHDDGRADVAQVDADAVGGDQPGGGQAVADEQVVDDVLDLGAVEEHVPAPPFLELQVARRFGIDLGVEVVLLAPQRIGGVEVLEILHQPGAVELAVAQVAGHLGQPAAAQQPARVAHGVHVAPAGPVRQRRAGHDDGAEQLGPHRGRHHDLPAGLAVADHHRAAFGLRMQGDDFFQEARLGAHHVLDRLGVGRVRQEGGEVAGMAGAHRHADFAFGLEAADAGAVPGARVDHQEGVLLRVDRRVRGRDDAQQRVVDGAFELAPVEHQLGLHAQHIGGALGHVRQVLVAALAHHVGVQDAALPGVERVLVRAGPEIGGGMRGRGGGAVGGGAIGGGCGHGDLHCDAAAGLVGPWRPAPVWGADSGTLVGLPYYTANDVAVQHSCDRGAAPFSRAPLRNGAAMPAPRRVAIGPPRSRAAARAGRRRYGPGG